MFVLLLFLVDGAGEKLDRSGGESAAVEETVGKRGALLGSESGCEPVGGLVLVELSGGVVPGLGSLAAGGSVAEGVGDAVGGVVAELSAADVGVVVEACGDVG